MNAHAVAAVGGVLVFLAGFFIGRAVYTRYVVLPRLFRERYGDYQVVTREDAEREKAEAQSRQQAVESTGKENADLQARVRMMQAELDNMKELQDRQAAAATSRRAAEKKQVRPAGSKSSMGTATEYDGANEYDWAVNYRPDVLRSLIDERLACWKQREICCVKREEFIEWVGGRPFTKSEDRALLNINVGIERLDKRIGDLDQRIAGVQTEIERVNAFKLKAANG